MRKSLKVLTILAALAVILICAPNAPAHAQGQTPDFTAEEQAYIASHQTVKVGFVQDRIPVSFSDKDGEFQGISRYVLDRVSDICGIDFEYAPLPGGSVTYDFLLGGGFDLVTSVEYNEENKNANGILISQPYFSSRKVVVAKENLDFRPDADWTVAVSTGSQTLKKVLEKAFPNFVLKDYETISECFDAVRSGDADLMIQNQFVVEYWLSKPKYEQLKVIPVRGLDDEMCFSAVVTFKEGQVGPTQEEGKILVSILDKSIALLSEDEIGNYTIQGVMENQYHYTFLDFIERYRYAVATSIIAFIIIIILVLILARQRIRIAASKADAKAKGRFLSTMSHEIRTPLNGLIGLNYLMSQKIDDKEKMKGYLRQSSVTAKYLLSLVNDILDSSKLEANKMELVLRPVDLGFVAQTIRSIESGAFEDKNIDFTLDCDFAHPWVSADDVRIQQVLLNLLDNARKFTADGGKVSVSFTQSDANDGNVLTTVTVADTGKGMSEEFQKHIFSVFSQELETVSKGNQGTGLGLSISRRLARLMGGDLTCVSKKGEGSTFTFTFLAKPTQPQEKTDSTTYFVSGERPGILIAEDNELNGEILVELLEGEGFKATLAENGKKALQIFSDSQPDTYGIILMDLLMPEMDGFETAKAVRALDRPDAKTVKIFACTANSFAEERDKAFASGMDDFITKPVDVNQLLEKLHG